MRNLCILYMAVMLLAGASFCRAESDGPRAPSLRETLDWMISKGGEPMAFHPATGTAWKQEWTLEKSTSNLCYLTRHQSDTVMSEGKEMQVETTDTIPLKALNPEQVVMTPRESSDEPALVKVPVTLKHQLVSVARTQALKSKKESPPVVSYPATLIFEFDDDQIAGRFQKALAHAIELCGGKPETF